MIRSPGNNVLMVGFHFPPSALSSGHLRLLAFTKYLPEFGWNPIVLSASKCAYEQTDASSVGAVPPGASVHRAFALDTRRHLGVRGKYPSLLAQPDRWVSWWPAAVLTGLHLIKRHRIGAIWSTFPIMTAHCVGHTLSRMTGLPWIADFRDPVPSSVATKDPMTQRTQMRWEQRVMSRAACSVFTTPGAMQACAERYPSATGEKRLAVIHNGFDEDDFAELGSATEPKKQGPLHFVHAGVLYPDGRNPSPFFEALANLKAAGTLTAKDIRVTLRASGSERVFAAEIKRFGVDDIVTLAPFLPYREALAEQAGADALLLFQGRQFDHQIPAKVYEYLRVGKPIFALVGERGATAELLRMVANAAAVPLDDAGRIETGLATFVRALRSGDFDSGPGMDVARFSRRHTAEQLAALLNRVSHPGRVSTAERGENP